MLAGAGNEKSTGLKSEKNTYIYIRKCSTFFCNLRSGSIFVSLCDNIPAGKAKRKQSLIQTFYKTSAAHFFDWLTFAESANQKYLRCLFF